MTTSQNNGKARYHFGEKIRSVRERKGLTLKAVAEMAGVSESLVSQIERNKVSPAIDTLLALADALDINLEFLFEEYHRKRPVQMILKEERREVQDGDILYREIASLSKENGMEAIEAYELVIPAGAKTHRGSYGHLGQEIGFILEGSCLLQYEDSTYSMEAGDSVSFSASSPHTIINTASSPMRAVWIAMPPQRFARQS